MIPGLSGSILSHEAMLASRFAAPADGGAAPARRALSRWYAALVRVAGPTWTARHVFDRISVPFCNVLGLEVVATTTSRECVHGQLLARGSIVAVVVASGWGADPAGMWRESIRLGIATDVRWCLCFNGPVLRLFDAQRTHSRRYAEIDLSRAASDPITFALAWRLLHADGFKAYGGGSLDRAVAMSEQHRIDVRESLQVGVHDALTKLTSAFVNARRASRRRAPPTTGEAFDESLVVVYRILFLLFAEARGLVPTWHPIFRDSYTIEALRPAVETRAPARGIWEALQAIARLAHRGCRAGTLRVPGFNGRLFSPAHAPLADSLPLDEALVREALAALTTRPSRTGRDRIAYADLGVEHLGGVYERVLDYDVATDNGRALLVRGGKRKSSGSFYTPRSLTEHLVRRTLAPLVNDRDPEGILRLRVVDPAMGSGAFLVAACRYLAHAYEIALVRDGVVAVSDVSDAERAGFRRAIAQRCLYGVDVNPMAVQLARLSLWLATLSGDRPLTFFDHHLRTGNSLVGARIEDVLRGSAGGRRISAGTPLFDIAGLDRDMSTAVASHRELRDGQEHTVEHVRTKEQLFAQLSSSHGPLARWKKAADLWCAAWFDDRVRRMRRGIFQDLLDPRHALPDAVSSTLLESAAGVASRERFFHWTLEFPDVFSTSDGSALREAGFDAVIGNPPWDVLRGTSAGHLTRFSRESGTYRYQSAGHANLYQLFAERSLAILRPGGRLGLVLPSGMATDHGCARLRTHLLDATSVDSLTFVENREALFPIHRGLKFVLLTTTAGGHTSAVPCRFGIHTAAQFDRLPDTGPDPESVVMSRELLTAVSGEQLAIPELPTPADAALLARLTLLHRSAGDPAGWGLRFGRELNATDDKAHFVGAGTARLPVVEGKQLRPFHVDVASSRHFIEARMAPRLLPSRRFVTERLAYRDVAAATNRLTLIAAMLPPACVTTHTLFCLKTALDQDAQRFVCGLFNSFIANYLVRLRVSTHVTVAIIERLPLPLPERDGAEFSEMVALVRRLESNTTDVDAAAAHQALAAMIYGVSVTEFERVLETFPLVDRADRDRALSAFVDRL